MAIASLIFGVLSFELFTPPFGDLRSHILVRTRVITGFLAAFYAVILGHRERASIRRSGGKSMAGGMATAGLVLGYLVIFLTIFPDLTRSPFYGGSSPVGSLRTINTAAITYSSTYTHGFPPRLGAMGCRPGVQNEEAAGFIDEILASGVKGGYGFAYVAGKPDANGMILTYTVRADPLNPDVSGDVYYFTDQTGVIRQAKGKEADEDSPPIAG